MPDKGNGQRAERKVVKTPSVFGDGVVMLWGWQMPEYRSAGVQAHPPVQRGCVFIPCMDIGKKNLCRRGFDNDIQNAGIGGIAQGLGCHQYQAVCLAKHFQPLPDLFPEGVMPQHEPCLVKNDRRWLTLQASFNSPEQVQQGEQRKFLSQIQQFLDLKAGKVRLVQSVFFRIKQMPMLPSTVYWRIVSRCFHPGW